MLLISIFKKLIIQYIIHVTEYSQSNKVIGFLQLLRKHWLQESISIFPIKS